MLRGRGHVQEKQVTVVRKKNNLEQISEGISTSEGALGL